MRRASGPLVGFRCASRTCPVPPRRTWVPSARSAFRRPPGYRGDGPSTRIAPRDALRAPSDSLQRSIAAPPHRPGLPKEPLADDASSPGLSRPTTHAGSMVRVRGASVPAASRERFEYLLHDVTTDPAEALRPPSVHGLHPSRPSPRVGRTPSREPLPSCRCPRRFASPLRNVRTRSASGPRSRRRARSVRRALASTTRRCLPGFRPSRAFSPSVLASALCSRPVPHHALGGNDVPTRLRLEVLRSGGIGLPLSGLPALLGFLTFRPSRRRLGRAEGGLMVSPLDSPRVRATNRSMPSRDRPEPRLALRLDAAVLR